MNTLLLVAGVIIVAVLVFLNSKFFERKDKRKEFMQSLASFLEAKLEPIVDERTSGNSWQIRFVYQGKNFIYEDIEDRLLKSCVYKVRLKAETVSRLRIDLTERDRTTIRANVQSLKDMKSPWTVDAPKITLPPGLQEFTVFSNDTPKANKLFANDKIVQAFMRFKNMTSLGNPYLSLAIGDGWVVLTFHPPGELKPTWEDLQNNPSRIEDYLDQLNVVAQEVDALEKK